MSNRVFHTGTILLEILDHERFLNEEGGPKTGGQGATQSASLQPAGPNPMALAPMKPSVSASRRLAAWAKASRTTFDDDTAGVDFDGHLGAFLAGAHYNLTETLLVGMVGGYDDSEWEAEQLLTKTDGAGWLAGGYLRKDFGNESALSLTAMWGQADNDVRISTVNGSFDSDRFVFLANYWKTWRDGPRRISGNAGLILAEDESDSYTLSNGTVVASQTAELGRFFFGPELAYKLTGPSGMVVEPLVWIRGIWDFENDGTITVSNISSVGREDFYGQIGAGLHMAVGAGMSARLTVQYDGLGTDDYSATTVQGRLNIPLN